MTASSLVTDRPRIIGIAIPTAWELWALAIGGLAGLCLWEIWANVPTPYVAGGPLEPPTLIKALFQRQIGWEPSTEIAKSLHYFTGVIGYPLGYFLLTRNGVSVGRNVDGWIWGAFTTFIALGLFAVLAGLPFMLWAWGGQLTIMSTIGHTLYGGLAAYVAEFMIARR
ncbi:hypothetical protein GJW-30_1_01662 [Variibacter gotjawalensis]|uniref:DUF1440 domain-containing protein n=1 Tax=Variibacter gotjawalensis TaxID=1333996 RepID=A0A0S3PTD5_9BRAD|nr:hypothetical protein [Variibacter gotjawalensis]NIK49447.1 hypothetical protein [Variibacter gotjawalensis]RZS51299.1 hypothetical protein EV661_3777 [Variibacter gotjawalensis]BAT59132.1 hypothetical protein GJW-30_1_01662 [Variibacter gotjawalensis]